MQALFSKMINKLIIIKIFKNYYLIEPNNDKIMLKIAYLPPIKVVVIVSL